MIIFIHHHMVANSNNRTLSERDEEHSKVVRLANFVLAVRWVNVWWVGCEHSILLTHQELVMNYTAGTAEHCAYQVQIPGCAHTIAPYGTYW